MLSCEDVMPGELVDVLQSLWLRHKSQNAKDRQGDRWETRLLDCVVGFVELIVLKLPVI